MDQSWKSYQPVSTKRVKPTEDQDEAYAQRVAETVVDGLSNDLRGIGGAMLMREVFQSEILDAVRESVLEAWRSGFQQGYFAHEEAAFVQHQQQAGAMLASIFAAADRGASKVEIVTTGLLALAGSTPEESQQLYQQLTEK